MEKLILLKSLEKRKVVNMKVLQSFVSLSLLVVVMFIFVADADAGIVVIQDPGSGGGSSIIDPPQYLSQNVMLPGLEFNASASNQNNRANIQFRGQINNDCLRFNDAGWGFYVDQSNPERFNFDLNLRFEVLDSFYLNPEADFSQSINIDALGSDVYGNVRVGVDYDLIWDGANPIITKEYEANAWMEINPFNGYRVAMITDLGLYCNEWTYELDGPSMLNVSLSGSGYCHNPEPATVALFGLGGLFLRRRRTA